MRTAGARYWDPYDARFATDPYPTYRRLREGAPLYDNEKYDFYAVSRFADRERGRPDWQTSLSSRGGILELIRADIEIPPGTLIDAEFEDENGERRTLTPDEVE